jgi:molybdenum cofactor cytidylyltransferase
LKDDQGAKKIIQQHIAETVEFPGGAVDLDTPEEFKSFLEQYAKKMP